MATIHQIVETKKTIIEMRHSLDSKVLSRPELKLVLDEQRWEGNVLHARGKLGHGTITLEEGRVIVDIELSLFGSAAKGQIEEALGKQLKRLGE